MPVKHQYLALQIPAKYPPALAHTFSIVGFHERRITRPGTNKDEAKELQLEENNNHRASRDLERASRLWVELKVPGVQNKTSGLGVVDVGGLPA